MVSKNREELLSLVGKKYTYDILEFLFDVEACRFKDLRKACPIEKMRTERLKELEDKGLIKSQATKIGNRAILVYEIAEEGKKVFRWLRTLSL